MTTKKDIPVDLLKAIEAIAQSNLDIIQLRADDNTYYSFVENDPKSKNFFRIFIDGTKRINNYDGRNYAFEFKPANTSTTSAKVVQGTMNFLTDQFENWLKIIKDYESTVSIHDDNFTKQYADFYYNEFKTSDSDAFISPFNPDQQNILDLYLDSFYDTIENSGESITENIKQQLLIEIKNIKNDLPVSTKAQVVKRVTHVFGKVYKVSKELGKELVSEAKKHLFKKLIELGVEYGPKAIEFLARQ